MLCRRGELESERKTDPYSRFSCMLVPVAGAYAAGAAWRFSEGAVRLSTPFCTLSRSFLVSAWISVLEHVRMPLWRERVRYWGPAP